MLGWAFFVALAWAGSINDIEHIVIFMQENRAFDEYYGTLRGVRGFGDPAAPLLPTGKSPFYQPTKANSEHYQLPYHLSFAKTRATCMPAPEMDYETDIRMWNSGHMDSWNTARSPGFGMSYFERADLPYYHALADAFTIGDQYFQSTFTQTVPNRLHLFSGSNGLSANSSYVILDDSEPRGVKWETMGETLQNANISWKVYQEKDNFDDNGFAWFDQFRDAKPGQPLWDKGMARVPDIVAAFADDVAKDTLPQVSWIVGPAHLSEHAENHPADGEDLSARLIKVLSDPKNAKVYAKTAFFLNYDEGGQFFDHHWTPNPPMSSTDGKSTVTTDGELIKKTAHGIAPGHPVGPGFRVPFFAVSPWTRGGYVFSQVSDHTSVVRFVEKRFNVHCPNISPWRRAISSDLTAAFDFDKPDYTWPTLPDTSDYVNQSRYQCDHLPAPVVPKEQTMPVQEPGTRPSRALPYKFQIDATPKDGKIAATMANQGGAGAVFNVYDYETPTNAPKKYTVEAGKTLDDEWTIANAKYSFSLHGPNGYVQKYTGATESDEHAPEVVLRHDVPNLKVVIKVVKPGCPLTVSDGSYGLEVKPVEEGFAVDVSSTGQWYDVKVNCMCSPTWSRRFMGRVETGRHATSDPAMARETPGHRATHPDNLDEYRYFPKPWPTPCGKNPEERKDACWLWPGDGTRKRASDRKENHLKSAHH